MERIKIPPKKTLIGLVCSILFIIPFFWFGMDEMDLGGDSSRLYFYDPLAYLVNHTLYSISPSGLGEQVSSYWGFPYIIILFITKQFLHFPSLLIRSVHGLTLMASFLFVFLSIKELRRFAGKESFAETIAALLAGLFYAFSPRLIIGWDKAIMTHNQIFVYPLMVYLLLKYIRSSNSMYLFTSLLITFIFAQNFSYAGAPPFFAFFPITIIFLLIYNFYILKKKLIIRHIIIAISLFFLLHAFHLVPQILNNFYQGSVAYSAVFSDEGKYVRGLSYFMSVAPSVKVSTTLMGLQQMFDLKTPFIYGFVIFPFILIYGIFFSYLIKKRQRQTLLLTAAFFLVALFLVSANITDIGFSAYKAMFSVPGFSMFRNYFGQWQYLFLFFYALLLGQALCVVFLSLSKRNTIVLFCIVLILLAGAGWNFINGSLINKILWQEKDTRIVIELDPEYERLLGSVHSLEDDSKILTLPIADPGYQMFVGVNNGAYQGPSTIAYVAGKSDFVGLDDLGLFRDPFLHLIKEKKYSELGRLLSLLNIGYVFHNADTAIYDESFTGFPYEYGRPYLPKTQKEYKEFLSKLSLKQLENFTNKYFLFKRQKEQTLPHFYIASKKVYTNDILETIQSLALNDPITSAYFDITDYTDGDMPLVLIPNVMSPVYELKNNYHLHTHSPFVSQKLDNVLYPFVILRENQALMKIKDSDDQLDLALLHLAKRVSEIEQWKDSLSITRLAWNTPSGISFFTPGGFNSWEASLGRYENQVFNILDTVNQNPDKKLGELSKVKVNEQIIKHRIKVKQLIKNSNISQQDKEYLYSLSQRVFSRIENSFVVPYYNPDIISYSLGLPNGANGKYSLLVKDSEVPVDVSNITVTSGHQYLSVIQGGSGGNTLDLGELEVNNSKQLFLELHYPSENIIDAAWNGFGQVERNADGSNTIVIENYANNSGNMNLGIKKWVPDAQYVISFDYLTEDKDVIFAFVERKFEKLKKKRTTNTYFEKHLGSTSWKRHQTVITSDKEAVGGFLSFRSNEEEDQTTIQLKNIQVKKINKPVLLLQKDTKQATASALPNITFAKINPTKYVVKVTDVQSPYVLIFSEAFNKNWKVFLDTEEKTERSYRPFSRITESYLNNTVSQGINTNRFADAYMFESWKLNSIAGGRHVQANGYANAWEIRPSDTNNASSYTLVIEMVSQRWFYVFFAVSILTFIGLILYMVYKLAKR